MSEDSAHAASPSTAAEGAGAEPGVPRACSSLEDQCGACVSAAQDALSRASTWREKLRELLRRHSERVARLELQRDEISHPKAGELLDELSVRFDGLKQELVVMGDQLEAELNASFKALGDSAGFVTVALFGRTKAGKSTTMEALTHGDGRTRGTGRQHTTKEVKSYFWPPGQPTLRVVDTPGIEGYQGEALAEMAEDFVERSDLILFLISDDKASAEELDRFGRIRTLGKSVIVVLNVKEEDLALLAEMPEYVFDKDRIDGHRRRIRSYLEQRFALREPEVLPIHALAAWQSTCSQQELDRSLLRAHSRIDRLERRLERFAVNEARAARLRSPRDCLVSYLDKAAQRIGPYEDTFRSLGAEGAKRRQALQRSANDLIPAELRRCELLTSKFEEAGAGLAFLVDTLVASRKSGARLNTEWSGYLSKNGLDGVETQFKKEALKRLRRALQAAFEDVSFDASHKLTGGSVAGLFEEALSIGRMENPKRVARAGVRTASSAGAGALALWAAANFWNPTGWMAALAVAGAGAVAYAADRGAKHATGKWKEADRRKLAQERDKIVRALQDVLQQHSTAVRRSCEEWLRGLPELLGNELDQSFGYVERRCRSFRRAALKTLSGLKEAQDAIDQDWISHCAQIAGLSDDQVSVSRAVHCETAGVKLLVETQGPAEFTSVDWSVRVEALEQLIGSQVSVVNSRACLEDQIASALAPARLDSAAIQPIRSSRNRRKDGGPAAVKRKAPARRFEVRAAGEEACAASGPDGANARLAARLLGVREIRIVDVSDEGGQT